MVRQPSSSTPKTRNADWIHCAGRSVRTSSAAQIVGRATGIVCAGSSLDAVVGCGGISRTTSAGTTRASANGRVGESASRAINISMNHILEWTRGVFG